MKIVPIDALHASVIHGFAELARRDPEQAQRLGSCYFPLRRRSMALFVAGLSVALGRPGIVRISRTAAAWASVER